MTNGETTDRRELSEEAADAYRARREALHAAVATLEHELATLEAADEPDAERFSAALHQLLATLHEHIEQADAPDGLLSQIIETAPWFAPRAEQLRDEHADLVDHANAMIERLDAGESVAVLLADARSLSDRVSDHRHRGTTLLLDAYMLDVPAGD